MAKERSVVENELTELNDLLIKHVNELIKDRASSVFRSFKKKISDLFDEISDSRKILPYKMDIFERSEMAKERCLVENKFND